MYGGRVICKLCIVLLHDLWLPHWLRSGDWGGKDNIWPCVRYVNYMKSLMIQGKATGQYFQININRVNLHIFHFILNEVMMAAMRQKRNYRLPSYTDRC
jgi:hypothetical protein